MYVRTLLSHALELSMRLSVLANRRPGAPQRLPDFTKMPSWPSEMRFPFLSMPMLGGGEKKKKSNVLLLLI